MPGPTVCIAMPGSLVVPTDGAGIGVGAGSTVSVTKGGSSTGQINCNCTCSPNRIASPSRSRASVTGAPLMNVPLVLFMSTNQ